MHFIEHDRNSINLEFVRSISLSSDAGEIVADHCIFFYYGQNYNYDFFAFNSKEERDKYYNENIKPLIKTNQFKVQFGMVKAYFTPEKPNIEWEER